MRGPARFLAILALLSLAFAVGCNFPGPPAPGEPGPVTLTARAFEALLTQAFSSEPSAPPIVTRTPSPAPMASPTRSTEEPCSDRARFIADKTIKDGSILQPGQTFLKLWSLENAGTCVWTTSYSLTFYAGERLGAALQVPLSMEVQPGERLDLAVDLLAPSEPGTYQGFWRLRNAAGEFFGIGPDGDQSFWVKIVVPAPPTVTPTVSVTPSPSLTPTGSPTPTETEPATPPATATPSPTPGTTP